MFLEYNNYLKDNAIISLKPKMLASYWLLASAFKIHITQISMLTDILTSAHVPGVKWWRGMMTEIKRATICL